jgi:sulfur relay protein TusB/DsrH
VLIVLSKPPSSEGYRTISQIASKLAKTCGKVTLLFIQDGCIAATRDDCLDNLRGGNVEVLALKSDCEARGLTAKVRSNVELIDYRRWVQLVMKEHGIVSWTS